MKTLFVIALVLLLSGADGGSAQTVTEQTTRARAGVCDREAEKLLGQKAVRIGGSIGAPKRLRGRSPRLPELPPGTTAMGMWVGEALFDLSGKIARVWSVREVRLKPAFPALNQAIVDAIRRWEFEPLLLNGKPTPFCMTVTNNVDFQ